MTDRDDIRCEVCGEQAVFALRCARHWPIPAGLQVPAAPAPVVPPREPVAPMTGAEFLAEVAKVITPRSDEEIREMIADIEGRDATPPAEPPQPSGGARPLSLSEARGWAARIWCEPQHAAQALDTVLAETIAHQLVYAYNRGHGDGRASASRLPGEGLLLKRAAKLLDPGQPWGNSKFHHEEREQWLADYRASRSTRERP